MIPHKIFYSKCWLHYRMKISSSIITFGWVLIAALGITGQQLCLLSSLPPIWQLFLSMSRVIRSVHNWHIGNGAAMKSVCLKISLSYRFMPHCLLFFSENLASSKATAAKGPSTACRFEKRSQLILNSSGWHSHRCCSSRCYRFSAE